MIPVRKSGFNSAQICIVNKYKIMTKLLSPAKKMFLLMEHPVNMHDELTQWISELEFCKTELLFFQKLLNKYFLKISVEKKIGKFNILENKLKKFQNDKFYKIYDALIAHEHQLSDLDKDKFSTLEKLITIEHKKHKTDFVTFMNNMKVIKVEIFDFIENVIRAGK